jgi:predicted aspartyl protease
VGTFFHPVTLIAPSGQSTTVEALVDTGSSFTTLPRRLLESLGVTPFARVRLRLANGQVTEASVGELTAQVLDLPPRSIICVFGEDGGPALLGAHTLEAFLLGVDPDGQRLVPVEGWLA